MLPAASNEMPNGQLPVAPMSVAMPAGVMRMMPPATPLGPRDTYTFPSGPIATSWGSAMETGQLPPACCPLGSSLRTSPAVVPLAV